MDKTKADAPAKNSSTDDTVANKGNGFPGPEFRQRELTPEQMPPDAKVPSPLTQTNTSGTTSVGTPGLQVVDGDKGADQSIVDGIERYTEVQQNVTDAAQKLADDHRKLDEAAAKA